jgi:membrane associated rhomboid family serine protease
VLPLRDVIPSRTTPYVTVAIILLNALVWCGELLLAEHVLAAWLQNYGVVPAEFEVSRASTLLTSMFLHGNWIEVVGSMWYLWIFGDNVEGWIGHGSFIAFYLVCGIVATLGQIVIDPGSMQPIVGAGGATAGVMGAHFALYPGSRVLTLVPLVIYWDIVEVPALLLIGLWFLLPLFSAATVSAGAGTASAVLMAHVAAFVTGVAGALILRRYQQPKTYWT